ncbi:antigen 5 like allergen Cul n 1-like [Armigeres subalbatus]|uniref:antigen 5 like allergen Cul n 1-like n=1 Tax=Armigeres subalbatus TaxID=124917 RepID=UPI002ED3DC0A
MVTKGISINLSYSKRVFFNTLSRVVSECEAQVSQMQSTFVLFINAAIFIGQCSSFSDYCDKSLCGNKKHIACNVPKTFAPACGKNPKKVPMDKNRKTMILEMHNQFRNSTAGGMNGFPQAARMPTLLWDDELENLSWYNAKKCKMEHDGCRNTKEFRSSGQNLATASYIGTDFDPDRWTKFFVKYWIDEYKHFPKSIVDKYPDSYRGPVIGHLTQIINDRTWKIGCSIVRYNPTSDTGTVVYIVCNYSMTNMIGEPVYTKGKSASKCKTGRNPRYTNLCSVKERV